MSELTEAELLDHYQKQVDAIPEMRQLVSYKCEDAVRIISHFKAEGYCKTENFGVLFGHGMKHLKGCANPAIVKEIIEEWQRTK